MTNLLAAVIVTVSTNWTPIAEWKPIVGTNQLTNLPVQTVEEGRLVTNTTAIFTWKDTRREFLLETKDGPVIGERKVPKWAVFDSFTITNLTPWIVPATRQLWTNWIMTTNGFMDNSNVTLEIRH